MSDKLLRAVRLRKALLRMGPDNPRADATISELGQLMIELTDDEIAGYLEFVDSLYPGISADDRSTSPEGEER